MSILLHFNAKYFHAKRLDLSYNKDYLIDCKGVMRMNYNFNITTEEREYLRELAQKYLAYANLPIMKEREEAWYSNNDLKSNRPIVFMESDPFIHEVLPKFKCQSELGKEIERQLLIPITHYEMIGDDSVISPCYEVEWKIEIEEFGVTIEKVFSEDASGRKLGFMEKHPILDLKEDFHKLKPSTFKVNKEYTFALVQFLEELFGDILEIKIINHSLRWHVVPSYKAVHLMGLETMMYSMVDYPEEMHRLYRYLIDDILAYIRWQTENGLLTPNNGNHYAGSGSYGFTRELNSNPLSSKNLWVNMNSQESVGISPEMYKNFIFPYYEELAKEFGLIYYGCCEPVHTIWKDCLSKIPNLRKVSISPWCDEEFMGEALRGSKVIYHRKPSPNFIGVGKTLDEEAFKAHIKKTLKAAKGCHLEFSFRDIYTLSGDLSKAKRAVTIVRELVETHWK